MLATGLDRLQSLVSREFVLAWFIPWLVFAAVNLAIYEVVFGPHASLLAWYGELGAVEKPLAAIGAFLLLSVLAYGSTPLSGVMRAGLEGGLLFDPAKLIMRRRAWGERERMTSAMEMLGSARQRLVPVGSSEERVLDWFAKLVGEAWTVGNERPGSAPRHLCGLLAKARAEKALDNMMIETDLAGAALEQLQDARRALVRALVLIDGTDERAKLQDLVDEWRDAYRDLIARIDHALPAQSMRCDRNYPRDDLSPTRFGNVGNAIRSHIFSCYGLDSDYFWPRLRTHLRKDAEVQRQISDAKAKLDFLVLMFWLASVLWAAWAPILAIIGNSVAAAWTFALLAGLGPAVSLGLYQLAVASYRELGDEMKAVIDLHHLDLLTALNAPNPPDLDTERAIWGGLQKEFAFAEGGNYEYRMAAPPAKPSPKGKK